MANHSSHSDMVRMRSRSPSQPPPHRYGHGSWFRPWFLGLQLQVLTPELFSLQTAAVGWFWGAMVGFGGASELFHRSAKLKLVGDLPLTEQPISFQNSLHFLLLHCHSVWLPAVTICTLCTARTLCGCCEAPNSAGRTRTLASTTVWTGKRGWSQRWTQVAAGSSLTGQHLVFSSRVSVRT